MIISRLLHKTAKERPHRDYAKTRVMQVPEGINGTRLAGGGEEGGEVTAVGYPQHHHVQPQERHAQPDGVRFGLLYNGFLEVYCHHVEVA